MKNLSLFSLGIIISALLPLVPSTESALSTSVNTSSVEIGITEMISSSIRGLQIPEAGAIASTDETPRVESGFSIPIRPRVQDDVNPDPTSEQVDDGSSRDTNPITHESQTTVQQNCPEEPFLCSHEDCGGNVSRFPSLTNVPNFLSPNYCR